MVLCPPETRSVQVRWGLEPYQLLSGSSDGGVRMWDTRTLELIKEVKVEGAVMDLEVSRATGLITVAAGDKVTFLNASTLEQVCADDKSTDCGSLAVRRASASCEY
jgi:WD40 repeat protein